MRVIVSSNPEEIKTFRGMVPAGVHVRVIPHVVSGADVLNCHVFGECPHAFLPLTLSVTNLEGKKVWAGQGVETEMAKRNRERAESRPSSWRVASEFDRSDKDEPFPL